MNTKIFTLKVTLDEATGLTFEKHFSEEATAFSLAHGSFTKGIVYYSGDKSIIYPPHRIFSIEISS